MNRCPCGGEHYKDHPWECMVCGEITCGDCGCDYCDSCGQFTCKNCSKEHNKLHNIISQFEHNSWEVTDEDREKTSTVVCGNCFCTDFKVCRFGQDTKLTCKNCGTWVLYEWYE
jgi:hypothetical protein